MCQKGARTEGRVAVPTGRLCKARLGMNYLPVLGPSGQGRVGDRSRRRQAHRASRRVDPTPGNAGKPGGAAWRRWRRQRWLRERRRRLRREKKRWSEFFWGNGRGRCAVDLRKECAVSRIACIYVGAWAVCSSVGSSRAGVTVVSTVSRAHTTACPHATAGRRPETCRFLAPSEIYVYIWV